MEKYANFIAGKADDFDLEDYSKEDQAELGWCMKVVEPYIRQAKGRDVYIEKKVVIPNCTWGTCDLVIKLENRVAMFDYKFGKGSIDTPKENHQARAYALGAAFEFEPKSVEFHFLVPNRDEQLSHIWNVDEIFGWVEEFTSVKNHEISGPVQYSG
jgi:hypothetical protein